MEVSDVQGHILGPWSRSPSASKLKPHKESIAVLMINPSLDEEYEGRNDPVAEPELNYSQHTDPGGRMAWQHKNVTGWYLPQCCAFSHSGAFQTIKAP